MGPIYSVTFVDVCELLRFRVVGLFLNLTFFEMNNSFSCSLYPCFQILLRVCHKDKLLPKHGSILYNTFPKFFQIFSLILHLSLLLFSLIFTESHGIQFPIYFFCFFPPFFQIQCTQLLSLFFLPLLLLLQLNMERLDLISGFCMFIFRSVCLLNGLVQNKP